MKYLLTFFIMFFSSQNLLADEEKAGMAPFIENMVDKVVDAFSPAKSAIKKGRWILSGSAGLSQSEMQERTSTYIRVSPSYFLMDRLAINAHLGANYSISRKSPFLDNNNQTLSEGKATSTSFGFGLGAEYFLLVRKSTALSFQQRFLLNTSESRFPPTSDFSSHSIGGTTSVIYYWFLNNNISFGPELYYQYRLDDTNGFSGKNFGLNASFAIFW